MATLLLPRPCQFRSIDSGGDVSEDKPEFDYGNTSDDDVPRDLEILLIDH